MICRRTLPIAVLCAPLALATTPKTLRADTFKLVTVASTQSENFAAGDDLGNYAINVATWSGSPCGHVANCFQVGNASSSGFTFSQTLPVLGSGATYTNAPETHPNLGANWVVSGMLGDIFAATYYGVGWSKQGIFNGTDPLTDYLGTGSIDGGLVSSDGNVYFIDGADNTLVVALDLSTAPTPEPTTLTLLGTGLSGLASLLYRRTRRA